MNEILLVTACFYSLGGRAPGNGLESYPAYLALPRDLETDIQRGSPLGAYPRNFGHYSYRVLMYVCAALHAHTVRGLPCPAYSCRPQAGARSHLVSVHAGGACLSPRGREAASAVPLYTELIQLRELSRPLTCAPEGSVPFSWEKRVSGRITCT